MNNTLHVLNGDATLAGFQQADIDGDIMIWREVLSEGPVSRNVQSAKFWQDRSEWICAAFAETPDNYSTGVVNQLEKLAEPYEEINLWFEYDLHCQVNLLGIMNMLNRQTNLSAPDVYLISPAEFPEMLDFTGMGQLNGEQMGYLYDNVRLQLGEYDFRLALEAWELYVGADAGKLQAWLNETPFWGNMHNLKPAMEAHLKRLGTNADGLNYIHLKLLEAYSSGIRTRPEIYRYFWKTEKIYGMADNALDLYLQQLTDRKLIGLQ
ncbi:hypothetical protein A0256_04285 [Mucilaginibacter sp. PAMC 26640]|nr:hypothetical protein A0256_04285 [Mucilaginibacter sp. PAMC 26640]